VIEQELTELEAPDFRGEVAARRGQRRIIVSAEGIRPGLPRCATKLILENTEQCVIVQPILVGRDVLVEAAPQPGVRCGLEATERRSYEFFFQLAQLDKVRRSIIVEQQGVARRECFGDIDSGNIAN